MILYIHEITDAKISGRILAEGDGIVGGSPFEIAPGETWGSVTFDQLRANGLGPFEVPCPEPEAPTPAEATATPNEDPAANSTTDEMVDVAKDTVVLKTDDVEITQFAPATFEEIEYWLSDERAWM